MPDFRLTGVKKPPNVRTVYPLEQSERAKFMEALLAYVPSEYVTQKRLTGVWPWDPIHTVLLIYEVGIHPEVLVHPKTRALHIGGEGTVLQWFRPKTKRPMNFPISPILKPWLAGYVESLTEPTTHAYVTQRYRTEDEVVHERQQDVCYLPVHRLVKRVCQEIGFEGESPRGLRHTVADRIDEASGHDAQEVMDLLGTSQQIALRYNNRTRTGARKAISEGTLPP